MDNIVYVNAKQVCYNIISETHMRGTGIYVQR